MAIFGRGLNPCFINQLAAEAARASWWADVLADPKLFIAVRDSYLDVYWRGQRLFHVSASPSGLKVKTHEKYLLDPALAGRVALTDGVFDIAGLIKRAFIREYQGSAMPRKMQTLSKMKTTAGAFSGSEKTGCHEIAVRNPEVIDVEIAFPGIVSLDDGGDDKTAPRVDLAVVEPDGNDARLVFWEAKHYGNGELRTRAADVKSAPVCRQIRVYKKYLADNQQAVEDSYTNVAANLVGISAMGLGRPLCPLIAEVGSGKRRLTLGAEPKVGLIIFGFDAGQRDEPGWKEHLKRLKDDSAISCVRAVGDAKKLRLGA